MAMAAATDTRVEDREFLSGPDEVPVVSGVEGDHTGNENASGLYLTGDAGLDSLAELHAELAWLFGADDFTRLLAEELILFMAEGQTVQEALCRLLASGIVGNELDIAAGLDLLGHGAYLEDAFSRSAEEDMMEPAVGDEIVIDSVEPLTEDVQAEESDTESLS